MDWVAGTNRLASCKRFIEPLALAALSFIALATWSWLAPFEVSQLGSLVTRSLTACRFNGTTDFLVRRIPHGRTRKSVVRPLPNNDFTKATSRYPSGCERQNMAMCLTPELFSIEPKQPHNDRVEYSKASGNAKLFLALDHLK